MRRCVVGAGRAPTLLRHDLPLGFIGEASQLGAEFVIGRDYPLRAQVDADLGDDAWLLELSVDNRVGVIVAFRP
jgi:hypothetical protein